MNFSRRKFLMATGGAMVSLPYFDSLAAGAKIVKPSKKLVMLYAPNGLVRRGFFPSEGNIDLRKGFLGGFSADGSLKHKRTQNKPGVYPLEITPTLKSLEKDHAKDITMITGLDRTFQNGQDVHEQASMAYLTSVSPEQSEEKGWKYPNGRSLDQIIGDKVGHTTSFKTLEISCNSFRYAKEGPRFNNISWYGYNKVATSINNPRKLYRRLFNIDAVGEHVLDVSDLILADAKSLAKKMGVEDREKMKEFMHMIRDIEIRVAKLEKKIKHSTVKEPADEVLPRGEYIRLMGDLMLTAMQMGISNICTFMFGPERWDGPLFFESVFDKPQIYHSMTHNQDKNYLNLLKIDSFHVEQYSYILSKMKSIKESDGSSLLDNSIVTYGAGLGDGATHQFFDLPMLVAGKLQGQIKQGRLIKCKSGTLNSNLWLTVAQKMGLEIDSFADSNGTIELA